MYVCMYELIALFQMNVGDDVVGELDYGHHGRFGPRHRASVPDLAQQETVQEKCQVRLRYRLRYNIGYYTSVCKYYVCMYVSTMYVYRPQYVFVCVHCMQTEVLCMYVLYIDLRVCMYVCMHCMQTYISICMYVRTVCRPKYIYLFECMYVDLT